MTRRRDCTCAGTAPGYPQHEDWCGQPERPYEPDDEPVDYLPAVELHSVPTTGGDEQKPSLSDCLRANGVPRQHWDTVSAAVAVWMRAWFHDVLSDEPADAPAEAAERCLCGHVVADDHLCLTAVPDDEPDPDGAA